MVTSCEVLWPRTLSEEAAEEEVVSLDSPWGAVLLKDTLWAP